MQKGDRPNRQVDKIDRQIRETGRSDRQVDKIDR